jgi:Mrp family chromosome partitioning ATPase
MARLADSVLMVSRAGKTTREELRRGVSALHTANAPLLGVLVNGVSSEFGNEYKLYRSYRRATANSLA